MAQQDERVQDDEEIMPEFSRFKTENESITSLIDASQDSRTSIQSAHQEPRERESNVPRSCSNPLDSGSLGNVLSNTTTRPTTMDENRRNRRVGTLNKSQLTYHQPIPLGAVMREMPGAVHVDHPASPMPLWNGNNNESTPLFQENEPFDPLMDDSNVNDDEGNNDQSSHAGSHPTNSDGISIFSNEQLNHEEEALHAITLDPGIPIMTHRRRKIRMYVSLSIFLVALLLIGLTVILAVTRAGGNKSLQNREECPIDPMLCAEMDDSVGGQTFAVPECLQTHYSLALRLRDEEQLFPSLWTMNSTNTMDARTTVVAPPPPTLEATCDPHSLALLHVASVLDRTSSENNANEKVTFEEAIPSQDKEAVLSFPWSFYYLAILYFSTGGKDWNQNNGWLNSTEVCDWHGIECPPTTTNSSESSPFVDAMPMTTIDLENNNMKGSLPTEIGLFTNLVVLKISKNIDLVGSIPTEIGNLRQLTRFFAFGMQLIGPIPTEVGNCQKLKQFDFDSPSLHMGLIPSEFGRLESLELLKLIGKLFLPRGNNVFYKTESIPSELGLLTNLRTLSIAGDFLTGTFPDEVGRLTMLETLNMGVPFLNGPILATATRLSNLKFMGLLSQRANSSIPTEISRLSQLTSLRLENNELTGTFPTELGLLTLLETLIFENQKLAGEIPSELGNLVNLKNLAITRTENTGTLPTELGRLSNLESLGIQETRLQRPFPLEMCHLLSSAEVVVDWCYGGEFASQCFENNCRF